MNELLGQSLGRYSIVEWLGEGGMGVVYRAIDTRLDRSVAVKVLGDAAVSDSRKVERFQREARAVARLSHPNIVEIHDFGKDKGLDYAVTELLEGRDLRNKLRDGPIPSRRAIRIARQAADGLGSAHSAGIIHRDIKPENLFLTRDGRVKILDFGVAHLRTPVDAGAAESQTTPSLTGKGVVIGTPRYMSPEQVRGQAVDTASDIFSLGCVIYEMISGAHPFVRETGVDTLSAILSEEPVPLTETNPELPDAIDDLVLRCLEKLPENRFESARDLAFALKTLGDERASSIRTLRRRSPRKVRGLRGAAIGAATVLVLFLAGQTARQWMAPPPELPAELHVGVARFEAIGDDELQQLAGGLESSVNAGLTALEPRAKGTMWVLPVSAAQAEGTENCESMRRTFNVTMCLQGLLQRSGDHLVLSLEAVDALSGELIGGSTTEDEWGNLATFHIAPLRDAAKLFGFELDDDVNNALERSSTNVTPAFAAYLRGSGLLLNGDDESATALAVDLLETATALDPLFPSPGHRSPRHTGESSATRENRVGWMTGWPPFSNPSIGSPPPRPTECWHRYAELGGSRRPDRGAQPGRGDQPQERRIVLRSRKIFEEGQETGGSGTCPSTSHQSPAGVLALPRRARRSVSPGGGLRRRRQSVASGDTLRSAPFWWLYQPRDRQLVFGGRRSCRGDVPTVDRTQTGG